MVGEWRTRRKALLELLGLLGILEDKGVDVPGASDLELDVVDLLVLLYAGGCNTVSQILSIDSDACFIQSSLLLSCWLPHRNNATTSNTPPTDSGGERTLSILAPADLDELLDIGDFGRHLDDLL